MPVAAYGATNPAGTDPWPIESVLAKEALSGNPSAHAMLADYRMAREADTNLYNQSMEGQHAFAKKQLEDEMTRARWTAIPQYLAHGQAGAELVAPGAGLGLGDAINPDAAARSLQASRTADFAKNLDLEGKGIEALSRAGQDLPIQQIPGLQNYQTTGAGEHSDITVEKYKLLGQQQQAAAHAARSAREAKAPLIGYPYKGNITDLGDTVAPVLKFRGNETDADIAAKKANADRILRALYPNNAGVAGGSGGGNSYGATSLGQNPPATPPPATPPARLAPQGRSRTGLPPATQATGQATSGGPLPFITDRLIQAKGIEGYKHLSPEAQQQVWANRPGGVNMPMVQIPNGPVVFVGKDGKAYPIPARGG